MKNRKLLLIVSLVLALTMSLGGTLAYLQDSDADVNVMTLGSVTITQNEQERNADGELVPFTPNKPAMPAVGPVEWAEKGVEVNGVEYKVFTDKLKNVVDKIVTVTNTGKSDAYIRTIVAIEAPEGDPNDLIHMNYNTTGVSISKPYVVVIDDVKYAAFVFTYADALGAGETSAPSLVQLFLDSKTTNTDVAKFGDAWEVLVLSQAVQADGFNAVEGKTAAENALDTAFGVVDATNVADWFKGWADWSAETGEIGTPGDDWGDNNPPEIPADAIVVNNVDDLKVALKTKNAKVYVEDGTYAMGGTFSVAEGTTVVGMSDGVVLEGTLTNTLKNVTLKNLHIKSGNAQRWAYSQGTCLFENCTFEATSVYALHFDGTAGSLTYRNCDIIGWVAMAGGAESILFENCTISGNGTYGVIRVYSDATIKNCTFDVDNVNTEDAYEDGVHAVDCKVTMIDCTNVNGTVKDIVNVSGTGVVEIK